MTPIHYKLTDAQFINDLDLQIDPAHYMTHLCADTGMGKSSWVVEGLFTQGHVIFTVPQRAQITQLQEKYGHRKDIEFLYAGHSALSDNPINIVCTYDQLPSLQAALFTTHYTLVIDEVHKLYQAASYRAEAISNILDAIKDERYKRFITLSATFTPELVSYPIDSWLEVSRARGVERTIELQLFNNVTLMEAAVIAPLQASVDGPTVVRINNKKEIIAYQKLLEGKGVRCLAVNRDLQATDAVVEMLKSESMADYDVILTTSLLDEAININDGQINELIIFNSRIHPEELKQFIGRFRLCNPPIRVCLPSYLLGRKAKDLNLVRKSSVTVTKAAQQLAEVVQLDCDIAQTVSKANQTLLPLFGFEPLRIKQSSIVANEAAIMACLYKADIELCYQSEQCLEERFRQVFNKLVFKVNQDELISGEECSFELDAAFDSISDEWYAALDNCKQKFTNLLAYRKSEGKDTDDKIALLSELKQHFAEASFEFGIMRNWINLHQSVMVDVWEAFDAIEKERAVKVWNFHEASENNLYIQFVLLHLGTLPKGTVMDLAEARDCVLWALRKVSQKYPQFKDIAALGMKGVSVKRNNHFAVTDRFVRAVFRDYTATPPIRSNNNDKIVFNGIGPFGYQYRLKASQQPQPLYPKPVRKYAA